jgi:hypothetical protein
MSLRAQYRAPFEDKKRHSSQKSWPKSGLGGALGEAGAFENREWKIENGSWKMENGKSILAIRVSSFQFPVSSFDFPFSGVWGFSYSKIQLR